MRFYKAAAARPAYYDRNPLAVFNFYQNTVAPHAFTQRWTYTVPANRKAFGESFLFETRRVAAAGAVALASCQMNYTPSGGSSHSLGYTVLDNNTVDSQDRYIIPQFGELGAGDVLTGGTQDASTGGSVDYVVMSKLTEFDA